MEGFSVSGRVITSIGGRGLADASVFLHDKFVAKTKGDGIYHLDSMHAGTYEIRVVAGKSIGLFLSVRVF